MRDPRPFPAAAATAAAALPALDAPRAAAVARYAPHLALAALALLIPACYAAGLIDAGTVSKWGKFLAVAIMAIGLDLAWGYGGMLSLCQALFFCLGGYAMGMHLAMHGPLLGDGIPKSLFVVSSEVGGIALPWFWKPFGSFWASLLLVVAVPGITAFVFGWFAFRSRVRGVYFSIITQALTIAAWLVFCRNEMRLCGTNGLTNFETLLGFDLRAPATILGLYLVTVGTLAAAWLGTRAITASRAGRVLLAVRDNESRTRFAGYSPVAYKVFAFTVAAVLAGIGGALYVPQNGIMTPAKMTALESIVVVVMVALGGRGTLWGAVLGALVYCWLEDRLTTWMPQAWPFVLGGLFILVVRFLPAGIAGAVQGLLARRDRGGAPALAKETA